MIYMYGGPIGRDKYSREIKYVKRTIYVKNFDCPYLSVAYLISPIIGQFNPPLEEIATGILDYRLVGMNHKGIGKFQLFSKHPLESK